MKKTSRLSLLFSRLLAVFLALCLTQAASAAGGSTRISRAAGVDGAVQSFQVASTGDYAVYTTLETNYTPHLFSVPLKGGAPVSLTSPLPPESSSYSVYFNISADGSRVLYLAHQESATVNGLYSIPIAGGTPVRLSKAGQDVGYFILSPDGLRVVYYAWDTSSKIHFYRASLKGGTGSAVDITPPTAQINLFDSFLITPDSQYLLFLSNLPPLDGWGIYSMPLMGDGSQYQRLSLPVTHTWVMDYQVTPDSSRVIYRNTDESVNPNMSRLYSVPITGPATDSYDISKTLVSGGGVAGYFKISPDGRYVVFGAAKEVVNKMELYSYFLATRFPLLTSPVKLNVPIADDKNVDYYSFQISPDSSQVAYFAYQSNPHDLFCVPIKGPLTSNVKLNQPVDPSVPASWQDSVLFSPDSSQVVYVGMHTPDYLDLFSVPAAGPASASVRLNPAQVKIGSIAVVGSPAVSPDGLYVYYTMAGTAKRIDLYESPLMGPPGKSHKLSAVSVDTGTVSAFALAPQTGKVVYQASQVSTSVELFKANITSTVFIPLVKK